MFIYVIAIILLGILYLYWKKYYSYPQKESFESSFLEYDLPNDTDSMDFQEAPQEKLIKRFETLENKQIEGSLTLLDGSGLIRIYLNQLYVQFNISDSNTGLEIVSNKNKKIIPYAMNRNEKIEYKFYLFPLEQTLLLTQKKDNKEYLLATFTDSTLNQSNVSMVMWSQGAKIEYSKVSVKKTTLERLTEKNELFQMCNPKQCFNANNKQVELIPRVDVGDKKSIIWNITKHSTYYTIHSIINNLYLRADKSKLDLDSQMNDTTKYLIFNDNKNILVISQNGFVIKPDSLEQNNEMGYIVLEPVDNIGNWLTYGSNIQMITDSNEFVTGDINRFYKGSNESMTYLDTVPMNGLIEWSLEDFSGKKSGFYIKEEDSVYPKINGKYMQILKGNYSPSKEGLEISLGTQKNDNTRWIITHFRDGHRFFKNDSKFFLYHPKSGAYLSNMKYRFDIGNKEEKIELGGNDIKDAFSIFTMKLIKNPNANKEVTEVVDYYKYENDKDYFIKSEKEWKGLLEKTNEEIRKKLEQFNLIQKKDKELDESIKNTKFKIEEIQKSKCPPARICLSARDTGCIPKAKTKEEQKENNKLYDVIYVNKVEEKVNPSWISAKSMDKCMTLKDFNAEDSPYVKEKLYVKSKNAKTKLSDFKFEDFPESKEYVPIESIPNQKKITDFSIQELAGFEKLELKPQYATEIQ